MNAFLNSYIFYQFRYFISHLADDVNINLKDIFTHLSNLFLLFSCIGMFGHSYALGVNIAMVAGGFVYAGDDSHHHRCRHHFSAPKPSAPWFGSASGFDALFPLLALVDHWHGDQGMGGHSSQAPRSLRARG
jgi:hypothetical protein